MLGDGLFVIVVEYVFHVAFWRPMDCIGGKVRFGRYVVTEDITGKRRRHTWRDYTIKRDMGLIR